MMRILVALMIGFTINIQKIEALELIAGAAVIGGIKIYKKVTTPDIEIARQRIIQAFERDNEQGFALLRKYYWKVKSDPQLHNFLYQHIRNIQNNDERDASVTRIMAAGCTWQNIDDENPLEKTMLNRYLMNAALTESQKRGEQLALATMRLNEVQEQLQQSTNQLSAMQKNNNPVEKSEALPEQHQVQMQVESDLTNHNNLNNNNIVYVLPLIRLLEEKIGNAQHLPVEQRQVIVHRTNDEIRELLVRWNAIKEQLIPRLIPVQQSLPGYAGNLPEGLLDLYDGLMHPEKWKTENVNPFARGILLYGPPGTGKTSVARALSDATKAKFFQTRASSFVDRYVGQGPRNVRDFFESGRKYISEKEGNTAILFIDEVDGFVNRDHENDREYGNTLLEFIAQMDGFEKNPFGLVVMGATNKERSLDDAIKSRFDVKIEVSLPTLEGREAVLRYYIDQVKKDKLDPSVSAAEIARLTEGYSNRDLYDLYNKCERYRVRNNVHLMQEHFVRFIQERYTDKQKAELAKRRVVQTQQPNRKESKEEQ